MKKIKALIFILAVVVILVYAVVTLTRPKQYYGDLRKIATTATASSSQPSLLAGYAFDGDGFTRWSSEFQDNQWLQVELADICAIDTIVLAWETAHAAHYQIDYSTDGKQWRRLVENKNSGGKTETIRLKQTVKARYLKLAAVKRATSWGNSLYEFELYGFAPKPLPDDGGLINFEMKRPLNPREQKIRDIHECLIAAAAADPAQSSALDDTAFLRLIQRRAFDYFWYEGIEESGLVPDRAYNFRPTWAPGTASVACAGYFLSAIPIAIENQWISRDQGYQRALNLLTYYRDKLETEKGFYYHFTNAVTGKREPGTELSSIDSTLMLMGVITVLEYFKGTEPGSTGLQPGSAGRQLEKAAWAIYDRVDWQWMMAGKPFMSMGWYPDKGFIEYTWGGMSEGIMAYVLALGSRTHPISATVWPQLHRPVGEYNDYRFFVEPGGQSIFRYQYPLLWLDLRDRHDGFGNYYESGRNAVLACRQFCINQIAMNPSYGPWAWGLGAADDVNNVYKIFGFPPGSPQAPADGTVIPYALGGSVFLEPYLCIKSLRYLYDTCRFAWGKYGFADSLHPQNKKCAMAVLGLDQGTIILGIENYLTGMPQQLFMGNASVQKALKLMGFTDEPQRLATVWHPALPGRPLDLSGEWKLVKGTNAEARNQDFDDATWLTIYVPDRWENQGVTGYDGLVTYRKAFKLDAQTLAKWNQVVLHIGGIDDADTVYINGRLIGSGTGFQTSRRYAVDKTLLVPGNNVITIEVTDTGGFGGIWYRPVEIGPLMERTWNPIDKIKTRVNLDNIFR